MLRTRFPGLGLLFEYQKGWVRAEFLSLDAVVILGQTVLYRGGEELPVRCRMLLTSTHWELMTPDKL